MKNETDNQTGFTLVEVLVALFVMVVGLLGLAQMLFVGIQLNQSAQYSSQAAFVASDVMNRIRANSDAARRREYNIMLGDRPSESGSIAAQDLQEVFQLIAGGKDAQLGKIEGVLPQENERTGLEISVVNDRVTVTVAWYDARWSDQEDEQIRELTLEGLL